MNLWDIAFWGAEWWRVVLLVVVFCFAEFGFGVFVGRFCAMNSEKEFGE